MIKSFVSSNFRKFDKIIFKDLDRINIFLGNNNAGKTTVLESVYAYTCGANVGNMLYHSILRGSRNASNPYDFADKVLAAFHDQENMPLHFSFEGTDHKGVTVKYLHEFEPGEVYADLLPKLMGSFGSPGFDEAFHDRETEDGDLQDSYRATRSLGQWTVSDVGGERLRRFPVKFPLAFPRIRPSSSRARFVDILEHRDANEAIRIFSFLQREDIVQEFVEELSKAFPAIIGLESFPTPDGRRVQLRFKTKDRGWLPYYSFGDGMQRWYNILGGMMLYQNATHCIEEIDATLHPRAQRQMAMNLVESARKYNNQLFLTSHSLEFVDILLRALYDPELVGDRPILDDVRIITMKNDENTNRVKIRTLTGQDAYQSREKYRLELR